MTTGRLFPILVMLCVLTAGVGRLDAAENAEIPALVFADFDSSAAGQYAYLGGSIRGMLAARLAADGGLRVVDRTFSENELASLKQGAPGTLDGTAADYLVSGALFALSGGLNIQVSLYPLAVEKQVLQFSILSESPSALLDDVQGLAAEMVAAVYQEMGVAPGGAAAEPAVDGTAMFTTAHPELAYKQGQYSGMVTGAPDGLVAVRALGGKQSISFGRDVERMVAGDLDGDGSEEILTLAGRQLQVFALREKRWREIDSFRLPVEIRCHGLNLADLDGDGRQEIYLSGTEGIDVSSMIVTWAGQGEFRVLAQRLRWYLRPLPVTGQGWRLAGQERGIDKLDLLRPGVFLLEIGADSALNRGPQLPLPRGVNLFDFVYADLDGDGAQETVAVDRREKLRVYGPNNDLLWVSRENYAGSRIALGPGRAAASDEQGGPQSFSVDEEALREPVFVPGRLVALDLNGDGRDEIVVNESIPSALNFFYKVRLYEGGAVLGLAWNGSALAESWRTGSFRGYIADHSLLPLASEGAGENVSLARLTVAHHPNSASLASLLPGSDRTELTVYDLEFTPTTGQQGE